MWNFIIWFSYHPSVASINYLKQCCEYQLDDALLYGLYSPIQNSNVKLCKIGAISPLLTCKKKNKNLRNSLTDLDAKFIFLLVDNTGQYLKSLPIRTCLSGSDIIRWLLCDLFIVHSQTEIKILYAFQSDFS